MSAAKKHVRFVYESLKVSTEEMGQDLVKAKKNLNSIKDEVHLLKKDMTDISLSVVVSMTEIVDYAKKLTDDKTMYSEKEVNLLLEKYNHECNSCWQKHMEERQRETESLKQKNEQVLPSVFFNVSQNSVTIHISVF